MAVAEVAVVAVVGEASGGEAEEQVRGSWICLSGSWCPDIVLFVSSGFVGCCVGFALGSKFLAVGIVQGR